MNLINEKIINDIKMEVPFDDKDVVFICGSIIEGEISPYSYGMGNIKSDIDIYIITSPENNTSLDFDFKKHNYSRKILNIGGFSTDIKYFDYSEIEDVIKSVEKITLRENVRIENAVSLPEGFSIESVTSFIHRLKNSLCLNNKEEYLQLKEKLIESDWNALMELYYQNKIEQGYRDIIGNLDRKNYDVAIYISREVFFHAVGYFLYKNGDTFDRTKWLPLKLKNYAKDNVEAQKLFNVYVNLFFDTPYENNIIDKNLKKSLKQIEKILFY